MVRNKTGIKNNEITLRFIVFEKNEFENQSSTHAYQWRYGFPNGCSKCFLHTLRTGL